MPHSLFIETTIPGYCVARPSRNLLHFARQELSRQWWETRRHHFRLFTSQLVINEAARGEPVKAAERLQLLAEVELLIINREVEELADQLVQSGILPPAASIDALHLATAGVHGTDFLLTWNCKHIANPFLHDRLRACFSAAGVHLPVICTPEQFIAYEYKGSRDLSPGD